MNGYDLVRLQKQQVKKTGDTMTGNLTMTGNAEVVGNATSSTKLKTARTFTIGNAKPKPFDGTQNLTWTLQEIGVGTGTGGVNATYKTTVNTNQWQVNGANYKALVTHNLNSNIIYVGGVDSTTNESIFVPYKIIDDNSLEIFTVNNTLSINVTVISEALVAGGGGGAGGNFLPLTGGTVTGVTSFTKGIQSGTSVNWKILESGIATFPGINVHDNLVVSGTLGGKSGVGGVNTWSIINNGAAELNTIKATSIESNQAPITWVINSLGDAIFNEITAKGAIRGKGTTILNNANVHLPQGGGGTVCSHLQLNKGIMACKDDGNFHFLTANAIPSVLYCKNVVASNKFSTNQIATQLSKSSVFDEINSIKVVETENGLTLVNPTQTLENKSADEINSAVFTTIDEKTGDTITNINQSSVIATLWKANQELISKIESLQAEVEKLKGGK